MDTTAPIKLTPDQRKHAAVTRELMSWFGGYEFQGDDAALLINEAGNARLNGFLLAAAAVIAVTKKRFRR